MRFLEVLYSWCLRVFVVKFMNIPSQLAAEKFRNRLKSHSRETGIHDFIDIMDARLVRPAFL